MKRAEDFRREKEAVVGEGETKRNSLFFDAEKAKDGVTKEGDGEGKI
jgi:hypothetical protein